MSVPNVQSFSGSPAPVADCGTITVRCPDCRTRYRFRHNGEAPGTLARCGGCEAEFPLEASRRSYVVVPTASAAAPATAGLEQALSDRGLDPPVSTGARSALGELLIAVVPSAALGGMAYYFAGEQQLDRLSWTALGGSLGLLLGWCCLLWIQRND